MKDFEIPKELLDLVHNIAKEAYEEGYKDGQLDGRNEAWECAGIIHEMPCDVVCELFPYSGDIIFADFTASEAIEKIREYEQKSSEINVGDEYIYKVTGEREILISHDRYLGTYKMLDSHGNVSHPDNLNYHTKTGRHFPEVVNALKQLKEVKDEGSD